MIIVNPTESDKWFQSCTLSNLETAQLSVINKHISNEDVQIYPSSIVAHSFLSQYSMDCVGFVRSLAAWFKYIHNVTNRL